jgi:tetratricopeptide (TPR) repeat protein
VSCSLQLRYDPALDASPEAWFLPADSAARWLEELTRSGLAVMETRLFIVPRSVEDRTPAGLLVVPGRAGSQGAPPLPGMSGMGCRLVAGRLFVPVDAALNPPVTDAELRHLCPQPVSFFHPVFGLSGFEHEAALRVGDLVELPEERAANWNLARPGAPALPELTALVLLRPPTIEDIFGGAPDEIGTEPPTDLPPAPDEPKEDAVTKTRRILRRLLARGVSEVTRRMPHTGRRRTWVNAAEDWANRQLQGVSEQLQRLRHKELHRLLRLFETDPEEGLRHAIPLNNFAHRGVAPPSSRLGPRSLNFNPGRLGGGPADFWQVSSDLQENLRRRYREMADREMRLGRHRRAAYIYAELLGDLVSAANALKQGGLFREAALLYEEHLRNPLEAARCLAQGGLLAEAIERYERLGRWLDVADLYERAGDLVAAEKAIRKVVNERLEQRDILGAAKLVERRLRAPDEALEMLLGAWPASQQAASCLTEALQILARLGRHDAALERLVRFNREPVPDSLVMPLVATLGGTARDYPHDGVRHRAADLSRVLIARQLQRPGFATDDIGRLLEHLVRLAPQDRLLSRDANRYLAERRSAELRARRVTPPPLPSPGARPEIVRRFELPRQIQWLHLRREDGWFYALGVTAKRLTLLRGTWDGEYQSLSWACPAEAVRHGFVFEPTAEQGRAVALARCDGPALAQLRFPATDLFFNRECIAGTPSWLPTQGYPFAMGDGVVWTVHLATGRAVLSCYDKTRGQLQQTFDLTHDLLRDATRTEQTRLSLAAMDGGVAVALGNRLMLIEGTTLTPVELPGQVVRLVATIPNTRRGVAAMLHAGAVMYWAGADGYLELDRDLESPIGAFVPGGPLVLVSGQRVLLLELDSRGVYGVVKFELTGHRAVGVRAAANPGEFGVLGEHGEMTVYRTCR